MTDTSFDYIIIGGGTSGGVLASRLTEDPSIRVLVLEAGPDYRGLMTRLPAAVVGLYQAGKYHWDYKSEPEEHAAGQELPYKMGKILGGSSSINAMVWVRGAPAIYDGWAAAGCTGWSYRDIEPIYRRIERFDDADDPYMGHEGPISITRGNPDISPLNTAFLKATSEAGYPITDNYNGPIQEGCSVQHRNTDKGERSDVYREYLTPARKRPNLTIRCGILVERLVIEGNRVCAIEHRVAGRLECIAASREILLCAGTLASAQLLMLSGIGDPEQITAHGIKTNHALPGVGKNLHTHPTIRISYTCSKPVSLLSWTKPPKKWLAGIEWLLKRTGMAASNHVDVALFTKTHHDLAFADAQITMTPLILDRSYGDTSIEGFDIYMELVGVKSRGRVTLRSANPADTPLFRFNFLQDERDLEAFRTGVSIIRKIVAQPAFDELRGVEFNPGPKTISDDDLDRWIRNTVSISHHLVGSCRMGAVDDPNAVVGPDLKLRGMNGLRIVDNSIMPFVSNGNTHAPAIMIGEKAFDLIREKQDSEAASCDAH